MAGLQHDVDRDFTLFREWQDGAIPKLEKRTPQNSLDVMRVNQLDAAVLDLELTRMLLGQALNIFKYFSPLSVDQWRPELEAVLQLCIFRYTLFQNRASPGEALLNIEARADPAPQGFVELFRSLSLAGLSKISSFSSSIRSSLSNSSSSSSSSLSPSSLSVSSLPPPPSLLPPSSPSPLALPPDAVCSVPSVIPTLPLSLRQQLLYAMISVGVRYLFVRWLHPLYQVWSGFPQDHWKRRCARIYQFFDTSYRTLAMANFLVFLVDGRYRDVLSRFLGIRMVYSRPRVMRQVAFDFMNQQLVWQGLSEFFLFVLPFIDIERIRGSFRKLFFLDSAAQQGLGCPVCNNPPTTPYQANCGHVFCYYCLHASRLQDEMFRCPCCDTLLRSQEPFTRRQPR